ncbi:CNNM domain-containing protein [Planctomycetota bacterium]
MMWELCLHLAAIAGWLSLSAFFSGYETALYSLNPARLRFRLEEGEEEARRLDRFIRQPHCTLITILIGNNITIFCTSAAVTRLLEGSYGNLGEIYLALITALVITPFIVIFAEMVPKNVYRARADHLAYSLSHLLQIFRWLFLPLTLVIASYTKFVENKLRGANQPERDWLNREAFKNILSEGHLDGALTDGQNELMANILKAENIPVSECAISKEHLLTLPTTASRDDLLALARTHGYNRYPLTDEKGNLAGFVSLYDALKQEPGEWNLRKFSRELAAVNSDWPILSLIEHMYRLGMDMTALQSEHGDIIGVVTIKDLLRKLVGDIK